MLVGVTHKQKYQNILNEYYQESMINNFDKMQPLLVFPKPDDSYYFVQILQRKKDHEGTRIGGSNNNSRLIKAYYIKSIEHLLIHKEEMIALANTFRARVCINLNPRSLEKTAFQVLQKIANQMQNKDWYGVAKAYDSVCGANYHNEMTKRWLVDIDTKDKNTLIYTKAVISKLHEEIKENYQIITTMETRSGYHIITEPFNMAEFVKTCPGIDVHKDNPTALYIPEFEDTRLQDDE